MYRGPQPDIGEKVGFNPTFSPGLVAGTAKGRPMGWGLAAFSGWRQARSAGVTEFEVFEINLFGQS